MEACQVVTMRPPGSCQTLETPLHLASQWGNAVVGKELLSAGADPAAEDVVRKAPKYHHEMCAHR